MTKHAPPSLTWWRNFAASLISTLLMISAPANADVPMGNTLVADQAILTAHYLESTNKKYRSYLWPDGNFTVDDITTKPWKRLWATGPSPNGSRVIMQGDGNLCKYGPVAGQSSWCSFSHYGNSPYFMILRDFGDLQIYKGTPANSKAAQLVWTSALDAGYYANRYEDLKRAFGNDGRRLMEHWINYGQYEGRSPNVNISDAAWQKAVNVGLDTKYYAEKYPDLKNAFGYDAGRLHEHWMNFGRNEGRIPSKVVEDFLAQPPRSAHGLDIMRVGDWLRDGQSLRGKKSDPRARPFLLYLQRDAQVALLEGEPDTPDNLRWAQNPRSFDIGNYVVILEADGHLCTYRGTSPADAGLRIACTPGKNDGKNSYDKNQVLGKDRFFGAVQGSGFGIYKGSGPTDVRELVWHTEMGKRRPNDILHQMKNAFEQLGSTLAGTANLVAKTVSNAATVAARETVSGTTFAANELSRETVNAANTVARETTNAANVVARETVNTANKVANTTEKVAVQVGRKVEQGGRIVGTEIVRNGEIVGYAVANFAVDVWNTLKGNCGVIGRKVFPIDGYFQGAKQITGALNSVGAFNRDAKAVSAAANQCFEDVQDGFYCSFPAEIEKLVSQAGSMPGNLINLGTRVFNEAKSQECLIAGASTAMFGAMGLQVCALGKVVVGDAQKAFACFSAAEAKGVMKKFLTPGAASHGFPSKEACNGIGQLAFTAAMQVATSGLSNEAKAAVKAGKSNTIAIVADQLRSVYRVAAAGAKYDAIMSELEAMPECK